MNRKSANNQQGAQMATCCTDNLPHFGTSILRWTRHAWSHLLQKEGPKRQRHLRGQDSGLTWIQQNRMRQWQPRCAALVLWSYLPRRALHCAGVTNAEVYYSHIVIPSPYIIPNNVIQNRTEMYDFSICTIRGVHTQCGKRKVVKQSKNVRHFVNVYKVENVNVGRQVVK